MAETAEAAKNQQKAVRKIVKNIGTNRSEAKTYSASEAAAALGVSIPTLKRMVAEDRLESFRTPGGHLRILAESLETVREPRAERVRPASSASPVLQNRRERLEELTLEAQEVRARRQLTQLQREEDEDDERRQAEEEACEQEEAERQAEFDLEQERLEQQQAQERSRKEALRAMAAFRCRWLEEAARVLNAPQSYWLTAAQKKEIMGAVETEINKRQPVDEPRMVTILALTIAALTERYRAERQAQENRQSIIDRACWRLAAGATEQEKARTTVAVREAVRRLPANAGEAELSMSAQDALRPINQAIERRRQKERILGWAMAQLPFWAKTELDAARVQRECAEILADLPEDIAEIEAKEALEPTVRKARQGIEEREASKQRQARKAQQIEQGMAQVSSCIWELKTEGELTADEYYDSELREHLTTAVRRGLQAELSGDESTKEIRELVREIIESEIS
jgi:excisionase family DNA binding protein